LLLKSQPEYTLRTLRWPWTSPVELHCGVSLWPLCLQGVCCTLCRMKILLWENSLKLKSLLIPKKGREDSRYHPY